MNKLKSFLSAFACALVAAAVSSLLFVPQRAISQTFEGLAAPNSVIAGPPSGSQSALPSPRPLVLGDLPANTAIWITRAQIPSSSNLPTTFSVTGYRIANDLGFGATYYATGNAAPCTGWGGIESADGKCYALVFNGQSNPGWFGACGGNSACTGNTTITSRDISNNPQWRGTYSPGTTWDAVALQEAFIAAFGINSTPGSVTWNTVSAAYNLNRKLVFPPNVTLQLNISIVSAMAFFDIEGNQSSLQWIGNGGTSMLNWDAAAYGVVNGLHLQNETSIPTWTGAAALLSLNYDGTYPGLETQALKFQNFFCGTSINERCVDIAPSGGGAQGSTIKFDTAEFAGFASNYAVAVYGDNALNIVLTNSDCQGFASCGYNPGGGSIFWQNSTFENQSPGRTYSPWFSQVTMAGADFNITSGVTTAVNSLRDIRSEGCTLANFQHSGGGVGLVDQATAACVDGSTAWASGFSYQLGALLGVTGPYGAQVVMAVDDGGMENAWPTATSMVTSGSTCTVTDNSQSWSSGEWSGYTAWIRAGSNGFTYRYVGQITGNTATAFTFSGACPLSGGGQYHISGVTGSTAPTWTDLTSGYNSYPSGNGACTTAANSNSVTVGSALYDAVSVDDYLVIPFAYQVVSASYTAPAALIAKITAKSGGNTLTLNTNATVAVSNGLCYGGTPISDGNYEWIDLDFNIVNDALSVSNLSQPGQGHISQAQNVGPGVVPGRSDWLASVLSTLSGIGAAPFNVSFGALSAALPNALSNSATIDLSPALDSGPVVVLPAPARNTTLNFPAFPSGVSASASIEIPTNGTNSYTITFGSNATSNGTLATGTTSGVKWIVNFIWDGGQWLELSRTLCTSGTSCGPQGLGLGAIAALAVGTGLASSGGNLNSNAESTSMFAPGLVSSVSNTKGGFTKWVKASTVDNIEGSASAFTCSGNPTVTFYECGTSSSCTSPTTIGSATVTAAGSVVDGTVSSSAISAGDYTAWEVSAGTCSALDIVGTAQVHSN